MLVRCLSVRSPTTSAWQKALFESSGHPAHHRQAGKAAAIERLERVWKLPTLHDRSGDLGEFPPVAGCRSYEAVIRERGVWRRPIITADQMLESMPRTRAPLGGVRAMYERDC